MVKETKHHIPQKTKIIALVIAGVLLAGAATAFILLSGAENIETLLAQWPSYFEDHSYVEPEFADDENRDNNAFNIADFGKQGNNGWFYRYAKSTKLLKSMQIEGFNGERYFQRGVDGMEIKKDFIHTGKGIAPVLEWRVAKNGAVNVKLTYVKDVNGDSNPGYPDGVCIYIYKGEELLESHQVPVQVDKQTLLETNIENLSVTEDESLYFIVNPQNNNAYDGGQLYVAIMDVNAKPAMAKEDNQRTDNNANNKEDYGYQGQNGWCYMYGKDVENSALVSTETKDGYINNTSPALTISKDFIHPAINDNAIISWTPAKTGPIEVRAKYTKFEQNDGNPDWPDGVVVSAYLNNKKLFEKQVAAPDKGTETVYFREENLQVTPNDRLYFVVSANGNSSYDGGNFDISIMDRNGRVKEDAITIKESDTRQNFASVKDDFGEQGNNGWFFQEGYQDEPFGAYNIIKYIKDDKYVDDRYLEIKRDYVNVGERGESAVIKWKVAQNGDIKINASYTKLKNEDANPSWPDGTRVTLYHNSTVLARQEFAPEVSKEVTKNLNVSKLSVKRGDYITMVINGKDNNAYDGGKYTFSISSVSGLVGATENNVMIPNDENRTNNANVLNDFGQQGANGWFYQYGYYSDPFFAINVEKYEENEKYYTSDGIEIKRDYIMPSTKGKSANVKWKVAQDGVVNVYANYTKLINEDANPSWPDGTIVTLLYNNRVLRSEFFAADTKKEVKKDLSVLGLKVQKGDYITLIVNGKENTAYDGGLYSFEIEDATIVTIDRKNDSNENKANLETDFGVQGSNGWYYMEGRNLETASALTAKTEDNAGYKSGSESDLQIKRDYVQPGVKKAAMYQWVAAVDGKIDVLGKYIKFGHNDGNPSWPDGTRVRIYLNNSLLFEKKVTVKQGDGNDNSILIELREQTVKKGDILTFAIDALNNNAWDGGRLKIQIKPYEKEPEYKNESGKNVANLNGDFIDGKQGSNGWYYGYGNGGNNFALAEKWMANEWRFTSDACNVTLKRDGVEPAENAGAIYRWVAAKDGKITLKGTYYKNKHEDPNPSWPDGVKVEVYLNGKLVDGMSYDVKVSTTEEISQTIEKSGLEVKAGDLIDFVISAKANSAWDYGKLEMSITSGSEYKNESGKNIADLFNDFIDGKQGINGWYYGYGKGGDDFVLAEKWIANEWKFTSGACNVTLKKDGVEPAENAGAIYRWVAAKDGKITLKGTYYKNKHEDPNPSWPDGVKVEVYLNGKLVDGMSYDVKVSTTEEISQTIEKSGLEVKAGDLIDFVILAKANSAWDYGKLEMSISETSRISALQIGFVPLVLKLEKKIGL